MSQMHAPIGVGNGQHWLFSAANVPTFNQPSSSYWQEQTSANGRRYYYNKNTRQSSWEKPLELMTLLERADVSTVWKEFTSPDGRKYYYSKMTKESKWTMPEELKLAREQAQAVQRSQTDIVVTTTLQPTLAVGGTSTEDIEAANVPTLNQPSSYWQEQTSANGRRYYYNKQTRQSSWEKPLELMTPLERADASTAWKEFTSSHGRMYYYNKVTKESKWTMPEELKLAREQVEKEAARARTNLEAMDLELTFTTLTFQS